LIEIDNIMSQNCNVCEYKEMGCPEDGHCYMFKDKPEGRCGQFKPILTKEQQETKKVLDRVCPAWSKFLG